MSLHPVAILELDPNFGPTVVDKLVSSLILPDDIYGEYGSAHGWVAKV